MGDPIKVLFLCTGNSCRSQMAEAMLDAWGGPRFEAHSAGSAPAGFVHELAIEAMKRVGSPLKNPRSKSWDEYTDAALDVVITLCDDAAAQPCPVWPGAPLVSHWPLPDPAQHPGSAEDRTALATQVAKRLRMKIEAMAAMDWAQPAMELKRQLDRIGEI